MRSPFPGAGQRSPRMSRRKVLLPDPLPPIIAQCSPACNCQLMLCSPMVLYAKSLGASATILGVVAGMMPLLVIFQIPAAQYVARVGYKRFVYGGWGIRVMFIFVMALVPLASPFLNEANRLALIL